MFVLGKGQGMCLKASIQISDPFASSKKVTAPLLHLTLIITFITLSSNLLHP